MPDDRQALQVNWNRPPGNVSTRCPECLGHGSVVIEQCYRGADEAASLSVPVECGGCDGAGMFPGMQPPV